MVGHHNYTKVLVPRVGGETYVGVGASDDQIDTWYKLTSNAQRTSFDLEPVELTRSPDKKTLSRFNYKIYDGYYDKGANPLRDALRDTNFNPAVAENALTKGLVAEEQQGPLSQAINAAKSFLLQSARRENTSAPVNLDVASRQDSEAVRELTKGVVTTAALALGGMGAFEGAKRLGDKGLGATLLKWAGMGMVFAAGVSVLTGVVKALDSGPVDSLLTNASKAARVTANKASDVVSAVIPESLRAAPSHFKA